MQSGMLWFDNDPKIDLNRKITKAADYYQKKYGNKPSVCFVNPSMTQKGRFKLGNLDVRPNAAIMPNHLWIGNEKPPTV
jgi:hypothetical protein